MPTIRVEPDLLRAIGVGAALHGVSMEVYINRVMRRWVMATNAVVLSTRPASTLPRPEALMSRSAATRLKS